ncbi:MAG: hypothetical protein INR73_24030 [Williamsia sp.]|nr:hypothetical protein [Williamsia sp.]
MRTLACLFLVLLSLSSCYEDNQDPSASPVHAWVPQYMPVADVQQIGIQTAKATQQAGKIYAFGNYLFQNDVQQGFHVINNTDKKHPVKLAFLKVPYSTEIAIRGNFLYTNNLNDLVVIDISNIQSPRVVKRIEKVFPVIDQKFPPVSNAFFQCPDPAKGVVVKWELKPVTGAACRR